MFISNNTCIIKGKVFEEMTAEEFFHFCLENDELSFERDEKGNIIFMPPTGSNTGNTNSEIIGELVIWNRKNRLGKTFESSAGFTLPDSSQRSPDAAWASNKKWNALTDAQQNVFAPICPEFIVELRSKSDRLQFLQNKMMMWISNGAHLAWLIDPIEQKAYIYRKDGSIQIVNSFDATLSGEDVLVDFKLDLNILK